MGLIWGWSAIVLIRIDFRHFSLKFDQFLKIPKFIKTTLKLLSRVSFNYLESSIVIIYGTREVVRLNVQIGAVGLIFVNFSKVWPISHSEDSQIPK